MNDQNTFEHQLIAWTPTAEVIERAQLTRFMRQTGAKNFDEVYQKSIESPEEFTAEVLKFLDIKFDPPYEKLLDTSDGIEWSKWCVGGGLNITEMCVTRWAQDETTANQAAIIWEGEEGNTETLTYAELLEQIELCAAGLRTEGLGKSDAIGIHLPMIPETVILLLAIGRIGAIAIPVFSGYGVDAIASRMNAVGAKALFTINNFLRRGKQVFASQTAFEAAKNCPTIEKVFTLSGKHRRYTAKERSEQEKKNVEELKKLSETEKLKYIQRKEKENQAIQEAIFKQLDQMKTPPDKIAQLKSEIERVKLSGSVFEIGIGINLGSDDYPFQVLVWDTLLEKGKENFDLAKVEPTLAEDPLIILYTSGTTGKPKGIAHTHCGFPIKAAQDMAFGTDVGVGTRISWVTDIGWMMGPWLIYGALINGATIVIYDGAPDYPTADRMWEFCAEHKVEILGISPTLVRALATKGDDLPKKHDLSSLRAFASTGEPWNPAPWWWLFEKVGDSKLPIINYSGGTEISGGILMGNPLLPIKPCSFPAPCLGIDAGVLDDKGEEVERGKVGELAIRKPWIGMARGFWQEPERYIETYWSRFKDIWVHGDWAMQDEDGHFYILGRSDDTLKVAGKRVGPAEVESLLVAHPNVAEAAVIGVPDEIKGTAMVAFVVLRNADILSAISAESEKTAESPNVISPSADDDADEPSAPQLAAELKALVAKDMGKPLAPSRIHFVSALPKTRNAKVMRRVIRSAYLGEDAGDLSALENPQAVEEIKSFHSYFYSMAKQVIGTDFSTANALEWAAEVLRGQFAEVLKLRDAAFNSADIEGVHKMRVAIRRLRSALRDFSPLLKKRPLKESKKDLKRLSDALGAARDEDVAIAALEKLRGKTKHESVKKAVEKMIEKRRAVREKAQAVLIETLESSEIEALRERFLTALDEAAEKGGKLKDLTAKEAGREVISNGRREFCDLSESLYDPFEIEKLHELRIAAKRLRYAVELFDVVWNGQIAPFAEEISQMQTFLGELHDADIWIEDLSRRLRKEKGKKHGADFRLLLGFVRQRTKHYRAALRLWGKWQKNNFIENLQTVLDNSPKSEKTSERQ